MGCNPTKSVVKDPPIETSITDVDVVDDIIEDSLTTMTDSTDTETNSSATGTSTSTDETSSKNMGGSSKAMGSAPVKRTYSVFTTADTLSVVNGDSIKDATFAKDKLTKVRPYQLKNGEKGDVFTDGTNEFYGKEGYKLDTLSTGEIRADITAGDTLPWWMQYGGSIMFILGLCVLLFTFRRKLSA